mmetsp:Transcript_58756/g.140021  ORF Transcript_58756/g.140021 Transcript_58756/m.140021 type:complete len:375 (+) Transcript_58756:79-1203(+)
MAGDRLLDVAIQASFWFGGAGLVILKGIAYALCGSALVRSSMFESLGDVASTSVMWLTQRKVADTSDNHMYPLGKGRFTGLGVFFFSAFMCSAFTTVAIEAMQDLFAAFSDEGDKPDPVSGEETAIRRLLSEKPLVRWMLGPSKIDSIVAEYAPAAAAEESVDHTVTVMLVICVCVKVVLYILCTAVARRTSKSGAEVSQTLAIDHRNDSVMVTLVLVINAVVDWLRSTGRDYWWLPLIDPIASLLLALWILYGWMSSALEQFHLLSDRLAEDESDEGIRQAAESSLKGSSLQLVEAKSHHVGEGLCVRISVRAQDVPGSSSTPAVKEIAKVIGSLEQSLRETNSEIQDVQVRLCPEASVAGAANGATTVVKTK